MIESSEHIVLPAAGLHPPAAKEVVIKAALIVPKAVESFMLFVVLDCIRTIRQYPHLMSWSEYNVTKESKINKDREMSNGHGGAAIRHDFGVNTKTWAI